MKITVAIPAYHFNDRLMACINAIRNQRVIQADSIKVYDVNMSAELVSQVEQERCEVLAKFKYADFKETYLIAGIIDDNTDTDILILIDPSCEITRSAISEYFRLFLKFSDLALVYGRQMPDSNNNSLITRFWYSYFYPLVQRDEPLWHISRIFCSYKMMALKLPLLKPNYYHPQCDYNRLGDMFLAANIMHNGLRIMYNPLALATTTRKITLADVYETARDLQYFVQDNEWMRPIWNLRSNEVTLFAKQLFNYLHTYSSHPLTWFKGTLAYAYIIAGLYVGRHNYEVDHNRALRQGKIKDNLTSKPLEKETTQSQATKHQ